MVCQIAQDRRRRAHRRNIRRSAQERAENLGRAHGRFDACVQANRYTSVPDLHCYRSWRYRWRLLGLLNADQVYSKAARPDTCPLFASGSFRTRGLAQAGSSKSRQPQPFHVEDRSLAYQGRRLRSQPHVRFDIVGEGTDEVFFGLDVASKSSRWRLMDDDQEILRIRYDDKLLLLGAHAQQLQFVLQQHPTVSPSSLRLTSTPAICSL